MGDKRAYKERYRKMIKDLPAINNNYGTFFDSDKSDEDRLSSVDVSAKPIDADDVDKLFVVIADPDEEIQIRLHALNGITSSIFDHEDHLKMLLGVLRDDNENTGLRINIIGLLKTISFGQASRLDQAPDIKDAIKAVLKSEEDELRREAMHFLAPMKDEYLQRLLQEGLEDSSKALVSPEEAIQLLGYDFHADYYQKLRDIVLNPPSLEAKREAVRHLATDANSKDLLTNLLRDKNEDRIVRHLSIYGLHGMNTDDFENQAKAMVQDEDEYEDLKATYLTALSIRAKNRPYQTDKTFEDYVKGLESSKMDVLKSVSKSYSNLVTRSQR